MLYHNKQTLDLEIIYCSFTELIIMAATREVGPLLQKMREVLLGRKHMNNLRFPQVVATRDWDLVTPNLPPGPSHKLAVNGYYTRDGRREVHPPTVLADGTVVIHNSTWTHRCIF